MTTPLAVPIFAVALEGNDLVVGNLQGVVSLYDVTTGRKIHDINTQKSTDQQDKSFLDEMKTRYPPWPLSLLF